MSVQDWNYLDDFIENFEDMIYSFKEGVGNIMKQALLSDVFGAQGPATINTDSLNPSAVNPAWPDLSDITINLKGSTAILMDTGELRGSVEWRIEDSDYDEAEQVLKFGWFERSGDRAYIAAIHEFGLTGQIFQTDEGIIMGGAPIGRTPAARASIRAWFRRTLGMNVSGNVVIPRRSMLGKTADIIEPLIEDLLDRAILKQLELIGAL